MGQRGGSSSSGSFSPNFCCQLYLFLTYWSWPDTSESIKASSSLRCASLKQFPKRSGLLRRKAERWGKGSDPELRLHALVRVLQRFQECLDTTQQEHLQGEVRQIIAQHSLSALLLGDLLYVRGGASLGFLRFFRYKIRLIFFIGDWSSTTLELLCFNAWVIISPFSFSLECQMCKTKPFLMVKLHFLSLSALGRCLTPLDIMSN